MKNFNPKHILVNILKKQYQIEPIRGLDVISLNSKATLYIRYNKNAGATKNLLGKFWFGITKSEYEKYINDNLFIVCACVFETNDVDYLVFPSDKFDEIKKDIDLHSGQWKFNLLKTNESKYFLQISKRGKYDVTEFLNYFDFSPKEYRRTYFPQLGEFQPKEKKEKILISPKKTMTLEDELSLTAKDSSNPKNFEISLEKFFIELGFRCKRIGGPGETDILILEPIRFIVDGKSTKTNSISSINFTRIKRHMKENNGKFMVIVSVGFDPAVCRDAEIEGATLIDINSLITILKIHREYVLSPFDYIEIFKRPGILGKEKISLLDEITHKQDDLLNKALIILENLDFNARSFDEIKGRIDLYCERNGKEKLDRKELENIVNILSNDLLRIINSEDNKYFLFFTPLMAKERLKRIIRTLSTPRIIQNEGND